MKNNARIFVAGGRGLVGSAILRALKTQQEAEILAPTHTELDLADQTSVKKWFSANRPTHVYLAAGKVGGILANSTYPADFLYINLMIHANVINESYRHGVEKLLYLGSSCIYPRLAPQPISEEALLTGPLEQTNQPYALAKISGIEMCNSYRKQYGANFISAMPTNLYGPGDNFDLNSSHVLPAMIRKFHEAKVAQKEVVELWGTGTPFREFLHVDDLADACLFLMKNYDEYGHINVGTGEDLSIHDLAFLVRDIVHPDCMISWDTTKPDGTPKKQLDVSRIEELGWSASIRLEDGIRTTYEWFLESQS
jgi:GDP-L-fucose synthase